MNKVINFIRKISDALGLFILRKKITQFYCQKRKKCQERKAKKVSKQEQMHKKLSIRRKRYEKELAHNPYLQSKALWNDMYGGLQLKLQNSYRVIFILSIVIAIAMLGLVVLASETKIKPIPFIVHGNEVLTVANTYSQEYKSIKPMLATYFIKNFIRNVRTVSTDGEVNAVHRVAALSFVIGGATEVLKEFYQKNDPDTLAKHAVKAITITSVLRDSRHTLNVRWREDWRASRSGELLQSQHYIAQLTYHFAQPSQNQIILQNNPLGLVITNLSWSLDQTT